MSCSPFDLRDYFLRELTVPQQLQVEAHVKNCQSCREELERLDLTQAALYTLRDEEIPQRIAFVSDKVFEPAPWRRWLAEFWGSAARLGFASAAMLSAAVVVYALRPAPVRESARAPVPIVQTVSDAEVQARVDQAVAKAVAEVRSLEDANTAQLRSQLQEAQKQLVYASYDLAIFKRRTNNERVVAGGYALPPAPEDK